MKLRQHSLSVETGGPGLYEVTGEVKSWLDGHAFGSGQLTLFLRHTSASLVIQENADPDVKRDLTDFFARLVKADPALYRHTAEEPDDMPAHIKSALTQTSLTIPITGGRMALGTWQGIYLFEHRDRAHRREILLSALGE